MFMHVLIDEEGNSYNVELKIKQNKLYAIWEGCESEVSLSNSEFTIQER